MIDEHTLLILGGCGGPNAVRTTPVSLQCFAWDCGCFAKLYAGDFCVKAPQRCLASAHGGSSMEVATAAGPE